MIKGVFFDLGGTLFSYRTVPQSMAVLTEQLAQRLDHDLDELRRCYREANQSVERVYARKQFYLFRDYFQAIFLDMLARIDRPECASLYDWFAEQQHRQLFGDMQLMPGAEQTLDALKARGQYLSIVSNSDENMLLRLLELGDMRRWMDDWTSSEAAQSCKPDRRFFEIALQKSGLAAEQVLFVGDSLEQDIAGAQAVGMKTALIRESDQPAPFHLGEAAVEPDYRIDELPTLIELVQQISA